MKMSEGWKDFDRYAKAMIFHLKIGDIAKLLDLQKAADLMKEMAEALEYETHDGESGGYTRYEQNLAILKKFKEWK